MGSSKIHQHAIKRSWNIFIYSAILMEKETKLIPSNYLKKGDIRWLGLVDSGTGGLLVCGAIGPLSLEFGI